MEISRIRIIKASKIGLGILSRPDVPIPASAIDDVQLLKAVLAGIASGQVLLGKPAGKPAKTAKKKARGKRRSGAKSRR